MSDKRDEKIEERLDQMSSLIKHSEKNDEKYYAGIPADENIKEWSKDDVLSELPPELIRYLLRESYSYGDNIDSLRAAYNDYKKNEFDVERMRTQGDRRFSERRQDNSRDERFNPKDRQNQNEQLRGRGGRYYEGRQRTHS